MEEQVAQLSPRKLEFDWSRDDDSGDNSDDEDDYGEDKNPDEWMSSSVLLKQSRLVQVHMRETSDLNDDEDVVGDDDDVTWRGG